LAKLKEVKDQKKAFIEIYIYSEQLTELERRDWADFL
jgi:hypothetical protein